MTAVAPMLLRVPRFERSSFDNGALSSLHAARAHRAPFCELALCVFLYVVFCVSPGLVVRGKPNMSACIKSSIWVRKRSCTFPYFDVAQC